MDLSPFLLGKLFEAGQNLFDQLGIKLNSSTSTSIEPKNVLKDLYKDRAPYNLISESYFLGLIDDNLFNDDLFTSSDDKITFKEATQKIDNKYKGIIVYAVRLKNHYPNRTQLSELTRSFNRASKSIPVILLTLYKNDEEQLLSFSTTERTEYEQTWREGEKTGKVSLLRDIKLLHTHTGHKKILLDLKIDSSVKNFNALYKQWQEVFNVQLLNKKFFQELANWYFWATTKVNFPDDVLKDKDVRNATNVIRLLTRLIFVWFIKEKGLIREELFDEPTLRQLLKFTDSKKSTYYKAILQNLFFATLNTEKDKRKFRGQNDNGRDAHYFIHNVFRYKSQFNKPQETLNELFDPIPFLNGGLFECLDKEIEIKNKLVPVRIDGFSDRDDNPLKVPDELFFSSEKEVDLNKIYDTKNKKYKVRGLINLLSSYKFTIAENTPLEEDIALDPELLGKVFENLLANYNPETQTTARKQTGSFYTPREIVNYMVDESLISHLKTKMLSESFGFIEIGDEQIDAFGNIPRKGQLKLEEDVNKNRWIGNEDELEKELRILISYSEMEVAFTDEEKKVLIKSVDSIKVLDPACGSGAFPMGILHKLVLILHKLDPKNIGWKKRQIERAESIEESSAREEAINKIENAFEKNELDYGRKLYLIENCIYGIDIQPIAAQISKLRFFISLIVDQKVNWGSPETNYDIEPLPNLETKFVAANTLIGIERPEDLRFNKAVELKETELRKNRERYFTARSSKTKERYRTKDKELREEIVKLIKKDFEEFASAKQNQIREKQKLVALYSKELDKTYEKQKDKKLTDGQKKILEQQEEKQLKAIKVEERKIDEFESQLLDSAVIDETASTLASWDPYDQNASASFFDMEWMFGLKDGFDIVIGNPPYLGHKEIGALRQIEFRDTFGFSDDMYNYFFHQGFILSKYDGCLCYITPNTFLTLSSKLNLREKLLTNELKQLFLVGYVFNEAYVDTVLTLVINKKPSSHYNIKFINSEYSIYNPIQHSVNSKDYFTLSDRIFFKPSELNMKLFERISRPTDILKRKFFSSITNLNAIRNNQTEIISHRNSLREGDVTLLGLLCEGAQGLVTGNNSKYLATICYNESEAIEIENKLRTRIEEISGSVVRKNINLYDLAEKLKIKKKNPAIFGKFFLYKTVTFNSLNYFDSLPNNIRENGSPKSLLWVAYARGNEEGRKWWVPDSEAINWSQKYVQELKEGKTTNSRWQGSEFYSTTGFGWVDYFTDKIKSFFISPGPYSKNVVKFHSFSVLPDKFFVGLLNSKLITYYVKNFITNTHTLQINDGKQIPIIIPNETTISYYVLIVDYIVLLIKYSRNIDFLEQLIDSLTYFLYLPQETKPFHKQFYNELDNLAVLKEDWSEDIKLKAIEKVCKKLSDPIHPISIVMQKMQEVEAVKIIEGQI